MLHSPDMGNTELCRLGTQWVSMIQEIHCELGDSTESRETEIVRGRQRDHRILLWQLAHIYMSHSG